MTEELTVLDFFDVFKDAVEGKRIRHLEGNDNSKKQWLHISRRLSIQYGISFVNDAGECFHWEILVRQPNWEVESEKPKRLFVWAVSDDNGANYIYNVEPFQKKNGKWFIDRGGCMYMKDASFPNDCVVKFCLVPAEEIAPE